LQGFFYALPVEKAVESVDNSFVFPVAITLDFSFYVN
jgi:hypothetical protein